MQLPPNVHLFVTPLEPVRSAKAGSVTTSLEVAYSNVFQREAARGGRSLYEADLELLTVSPRLAWRPVARVELGVSVPLHSAGSGFLDRPIQDYHDVFDFQNGGRESWPNDRFRSRLVVGGRKVYEGRQGAGLGDVAFTQSVRLAGRDDEPFRLALRTGVELPTGNAARGFGSGEVDLGAALAATAETGGVALHAQVLWSLPGDLAGESRVATRAAYGYGLAVEAPLARDRVHALAQIDGRTGFVGGTGLTVLDASLAQLSVGLALRLWDAWLTVAVAEDLRLGTAPDVTFLIRLSRDLD